ncbi:MAG: hypothetical protein LBK58_14460 [Prevotellaceae bacterium]|jgi:hypothetical protein|nr:hypothetical protein [Prevotellaceae bacterium]
MDGTLVYTAHGIDSHHTRRDAMHRVSTSRAAATTVDHDRNSELSLRIIQL